MTTPEMHVWFRQYAQQMGAQNTRMILPEQIDLIINTSIADVTNQIIREHIGLTNEQGMNTSKIGQINALLPLYKTIEFKVVAKDTDIKFGVTLDNYISDYLFLHSFALDYLDADNKATFPFECRIIESSLLADTLNDFVMRPRVNSPIAVSTNGEVIIYVGNNGILLPNKLYINYIKKPNVVKLGEDDDSSINCDLPEYLHVAVMKHAVDLWKATINGANPVSQQQVPQGQASGVPQQVQ